MKARHRHPRLILAICCMSLLIVSMDATAVNVALPSIRDDLGASGSSLQWIVDAYLLVLASLLILSGSTADRLGRRRTFQLGLVVFVAGSILCSIAPDVEWLIGFRMVQAAGGSMLNPVAMSIITVTFLDDAARARAIGLWAAVSGVSLAVGPLVGGALTDAVGWRGIFWINLPIGLVAFILAGVFVPESSASRRRRLDPWGQVLVIVLLASMVGGLIEGPHLGWSSPWTIAMFATALASFAMLVWLEDRRVEPLIDVRFFRSLPFSSAVLTAIAGYVSNGAFLFLFTLYLQEARGLSPLDAGVHMLPLAVAQMICAPLSGRLVATRGTRLPSMISAVLLGIAAVSLTFLTPTTPMRMLLAVFAIYGAGLGLINAPITTTAVAGMPRSQVGSAAAIASTSRQVGTSLGVALAGSLTGIGASTQLSSSFTQDTHRMWWVVSALSVAMFVLAALATSARGRRSRDAVAHLLADEGTRAPRGGAATTLDSWRDVDRA